MASNSQPPPPDLNELARKLLHIREPYPICCNPIDVTVNIDNQNYLSGAVYDNMATLRYGVEPKMSRDDFIRMWKTLIPMRVQNVFRRAKGVRANNEIQLDRSISAVPQPLKDLLLHLGYSERYHLIPPPMADPAPNWWQVDSNITSAWIRLMNRIRLYYRISEFSAIDVCEGPNLCQTTIEDKGDNRLVASYTAEASREEVFIRFVNDDLFLDRPYQFADCGYYRCHLINRMSVVSRYICSYDIKYEQEYNI